jgi:hypothetical protein
MKYASKNENLNLNIHIDDVRIIDDCILYEKTQRYAKEFLNNNLLPSNTYRVKNSDQLINLLPKSVLDKEVPSVLYIELISTFYDIAMLPPHIDIRRNVAINYYFDTNNEKTTFYNYDSVTKNINEIESFVSNNNESWLLNVSIPHSVTFYKPFKRKFLSFSFNKLTYDQLKELLHE